MQQSKVHTFAVLFSLFALTDIPLVESRLMYNEDGLREKSIKGSFFPKPQTTNNEIVHS